MVANAAMTAATITPKALMRATAAGAESWM
jgi:hypothetical protein